MLIILDAHFVNIASDVLYQSFVFADLSSVNIDGSLTLADFVDGAEIEPISIVYGEILLDVFILVDSGLGFDKLGLVEILSDFL